MHQGTYNAISEITSHHRGGFVPLEREEAQRDHGQHNPTDEEGLGLDRALAHKRLAQEASGILRVEGLDEKAVDSGGEGRQVQLAGAGESTGKDEDDVDG
jgi:hypothetical protein